jgi:hypothetical protein
MPSLMVVSGGLGREELEDFASQRVLSSLLTLDVPKELCSVSLANRDTCSVSCSRFPIVLFSASVFPDCIEAR